MKMLLSHIAGFVNGRLTGEDVGIDSVSIDTRALKPGQLYVAIKGPRFDGNDFVAQAESAGAIAAIVHHPVVANIPCIHVDDTHLALAELAGAWRRELGKVDNNHQPISIVGVTGSNGKTTVKEMVAAVLGIAGEVLFTQGNLNNDIGVPLTLLKLNENHRYGVIEMGANHPGEIEYTSKYAQADVVVITNAGAAHIEGFGSLKGVAEAKGEIIQTLKADGCAVINRDDDYCDYWKTVAGSRKVITFGLNDEADVSARAINTEIRIETSNSGNAASQAAGFYTTFEAVTKHGQESMTLNLAGPHNVVNALAAIAIGQALGLTLTQIKQGLATVKPVTGRLQPLIGRTGNIVIDDTYNANSASLQAGLEVLKSCRGEPWVVLGAFGEQGPDSPKIHEQLGQLIKLKGVVRLWATGTDAKNTVRSFGKGAVFFESQSELIESLKQALNGHETILVKGSRAQRMENVVAALVDNFRI